MSKGEARELRRALASTERGRGKRVPEELKKRVVAYVRERRAEGAGYRDVAQELGLSSETARRWCATAAGGRPKRSRRSMVPVEVAAEQPRGVLVSPSGYRVEGLDLGELAALLRALS
jgi:transposase-like protein